MPPHREQCHRHAKHSEQERTAQRKPPQLPADQQTDGEDDLGGRRDPGKHRHETSRHERHQSRGIGDEGAEGTPEDIRRARWTPDSESVCDSRKEGRGQSDAQYEHCDLTTATR